ncbi:hypothetical protein ABTW24_13175 [Sphingobacterium thalpophilum]|uniref:Uncharacterized protein n=1 Tax=Sphingobacterium thalpophilum TaxID=259 RepID=A0ABV4HDH9_9SPHI|nr:hypothetical protein [Sphingobacterium thalpophilum]
MKKTIFTSLIGIIALIACNSPIESLDMENQNPNDLHPPSDNDVNMFLIETQTLINLIQMERSGVITQNLSGGRI